MPKLTPQAKKSFAVSAVIGAMLVTKNNGDPKLIALKIQIDKAMKEFRIKSTKQYFSITDEVRDIWIDIVAEYSGKITADEISIFIELVANLISPKDFKNLLKMSPYKTNEKISDDKKSQLVASVLTLDAELNKMFKVLPTATKEDLLLAVNKPIKIKKEKNTHRDKAVPKKLKRLRNTIKYIKKKNSNSRKETTE